MKGLVIKDFYCLRKNMWTFVLLTIGVIVMGILFVLSSQYGNVADALAEIQLESDSGNVDAEITMQIFDIGVAFLMVIPIAFIGQINDCFKEDSRVGFKKALSTLPLSHFKLVGSRYLSCLIFTAICMALSIFTAFSITLVPGKYRFSEYIALIISISACFSIYMAVVIFFTYLFGGKHSDTIQIIPFILAFFLGGVWSATTMNRLSETEVDLFLRNIGHNVKNFFQHNSLFLVLCAVLCMTISYLGSVAILKYRKEVL